MFFASLFFTSGTHDTVPTSCTWNTPDDGRKSAVSTAGSFNPRKYQQQTPHFGPNLFLFGGRFRDLETSIPKLITQWDAILFME